ncbi:MAG: HD domain-containing protein [Halorientalis sp.]
MTHEVGPLARELALPYYEDALPAHDRFHARRVRDLALRLASDCEPTVDTDVLAAAAWLHDIGRPRERTGVIDDHDEWAVAEATDLLATQSVPTDRIAAVTDCIETHSIRASSPDPETIEAKLLFDADKLDAAGARGIVRLACIVGERSGRAGERYAAIDSADAHDVAIADLPDVSLLCEWARERLDRLYTDPGQRLGESRWQFVETFFEQFAAEIGSDAER